MSRTSKNESVINGLWERVKCEQGDLGSLDFQLLYFSNHNLIFFNKSYSARLFAHDYSYNIADDKLIFFAKGLSNTRKIATFQIKTLNAFHMTLRIITDNGNWELEFVRIRTCINDKVEKVAVASGGLQAWDVEVDNDLDCYAAWNRDIPKEVIKWNFPKWKWEAILRIYSAYQIRTFLDNRLDFACCGGSYSMIIKRSNGQTIKIFPATKAPFYVRTIFEIVWLEAMRKDLDGLPRVKGKINLHEELMRLSGLPISSSSIKTLR